jgi:hypothetical protein
VAAAQLIDAYVDALPGGGRRLAHGEWGVTVGAEAAAGWPLDVGLRLDEGLLRVQAFALSADERINPWNFLHWNRSTRMIRFSCTRAGDIWVQADLPASAVDEQLLDRLLGLITEGALAARQAMSARGEAEEPSGEGWGALR